MEKTPHSVQRSQSNQLDGDETILLCDDDDIVLDSCRFLLRTRGYTVICAGSGREALEVAASYAGKIDLLLADVNMPEMNGWQLARELTAQRSDLKVIFVSGNAEDVFKAGAPRGEHIVFVEKPAERDTLFRRIREVLDAPMPD